MPTLNDPAASKPIKLLLFGDSGTGKTGALGTLAAKYRLFICDFDNGLDILRDPKVLLPEHRGNVYFKTFTEKLYGVSATPRGGSVVTTAFFDVMQTWEEEIDGKKTDLGNIYKWGRDTIFVIDSLSFFSNAVERHVKGLNSDRKTGDRLSLPEIGSVQNIIKNMLSVLYSDSINCHIIMTVHTKMKYEKVSVVGNDGKTTLVNDPNSGKEIAAVVGTALAVDIPKFFNNSVALVKVGSGRSVERQLHTRGTATLDLKVSRPYSIPPVMEPNLLKLFEMLQA